MINTFTYIYALITFPHNFEKQKRCFGEKHQCVFEKCPAWDKCIWKSWCHIRVACRLKNDWLNNTYVSQEETFSIACGWNLVRHMFIVVWHLHWFQIKALRVVRFWKFPLARAISYFPGPNKFLLCTGNVCFWRVCSKPAGHVLQQMATSGENICTRLPCFWSNSETPHHFPCEPGLRFCKLQYAKPVN